MKLVYRFWSVSALKYSKRIFSGNTKNNIEQFLCEGCLVKIITLFRLS